MVTDIGYNDRYIKLQISGNGNLGIKKSLTYSTVHYFSMFQVDGVVKSSLLGEGDVKWRLAAKGRQEEGNR